MMKPQPITLTPLDTRLRVLLFCLLLATYLTVYVPQPDSADGDAVLAVATATLREGSPNINAVAYADWLLPMPASRMGAFGLDGALYAKKGPTPSLFLLPLVALAEALPWLTTRATAMLLNPLVTASTAVLLYTLVRRLGYRPEVALVSGLLYGLATLAIVYSKTLFGEPLAALLLLIAFMGMVSYHASGRAQPLLVSGSALGLLVGVNTVYAVFVPLGAILTFGPVLMQREKLSLRALLAAAVPVLLALGLLGLYNLARFGSPLDGGYHFSEGEGFTQPLLTGLYGLLISPFRGLFPYNPILLLTLPGWLLLRRYAPSIAWAALVLVLAQLLLFASWWSWHGGIVWGPRFLVPVLPLLALMLVPLVDAALHYQRKSAGLALLLIVMTGLSLGTQALGALYDYGTYNNGYLNARFWTGDFNAIIPGLPDFVLTTPELSPIVGHLALASAGWPLEPALLRSGDVAHLMSVAAIAIAGLLALIDWWPPRWAALSASIVSAVCMSVIVAQQSARPDVAAVRALTTQLSPGDTVIAATTLYESTLLDLQGKRIVTLNAPTEADDPWARSLWNDALNHASDVWLLTWFGPADSFNWQERELWQDAAFVSERAAGNHRALLFDLNTVEPSQPVDVSFGPIRLSGYNAILRDERVEIALAWAADSPPDAAYAWFVHLIDADGNIVAQQDRSPQGGYAPTSSWAPGDLTTDRLAFLLSDNVTRRGLRLRIGWLDPATGTPLPIRVDGVEQSEPYILLPVSDAP